MSLPKPIQNATQIVIHHAPFFAHLIMALEWTFSKKIETACTDGQTVWVNREFLEGLSRQEQAGLIAHEAMHCAFQHVKRAKKWVETDADQRRWNVAADIVVNGAILNAGLELPKGAIVDQK